MYNLGMESGYVYILEVKDIVLPVCKIGRTSRTPKARCEEINTSATGDFIWEVAHFVYTDDCKELEALVHRKLAPLRQKKREFFNLGADDAFIAIQSIINSQFGIKILDPPVTNPDESKKVQRKARKSGTSSGRHTDPRYARYLDIFNMVLNIKGKPFGQLNKPSFGMSDGNPGTQWNLMFTAGSDEAYLGVNLEGMKYDDWPIARLLLSERDNPSLENLKLQVKDPDELFISLRRDAWQATSRPSIENQFIGGGILSVAETDNLKWLDMVREALDCLDSARSYRGRAKQLVTLKNGSTKEMGVSPHLTILCEVKLGENFDDDLRQKLREMQPIYDWVKELAETTLNEYHK
ncbi:MAG: GIY-YIG nuclease family protein [Gammaproteobacteria bacterium]|nr:GIY-YIG nuclease family protein [Gammaproteobacteria bacterium]